MHPRTLGAVALVAACATAPAPAPAAPPDPSTLVGTWKVDLRPSPDAPPYYQDLVIRSVADGRVTGTFYGSELQAGRINADWGALRLAWFTDPGEGPYFGAAVLVGDRLEGTTLSTSRGFLAYWTATPTRANTSAAPR